MPFRYGDGTLYGSGALYGAYLSTTKTVSFSLRIDWDNDGVLDGTNEVAYLDESGALKGRMTAWRIRLGREFVFNSSGDGFEHAIPGTLEIEVLNQDGRYDPYNLDSPLADYLYKNQLVEFKVLSESTGTLYPAFYGYIYDIKPIYGTVDKATIYVDGAMNKLNSAIYSIVEEAAQYDDRIVDALTAAGWDGGTNIDTTVSDSMNYHWFSGKTAIEEINDLADAAFGIFWIGEDGTANYVSRIGGDSSTQAITEADIDYEYRIQAPAPREVIKNSVKIYSNAPVYHELETAWSLNEVPFTLSGIGVKYYFWAKLSYNGSPAAYINGSGASASGVSVNTLADGSGTTLTNATDYLVALESNHSETLYLSIKNLYGPDIYIISWDVIPGQFLATGDKTFVLSEDADSIASYGNSEINFDSRWVQNQNTASEYAANILEKFSTPRPFPRFKFKRSSIDKQFTSQLFNLITIAFDSKGITGEFRVGHIERSWSVNEPNVIDSVYYLEPNLSVAAASTWTFPMTFPTIFT